MWAHDEDVSTPNARTGLPMYLGPELPRWQPRTVEDVQRAIDDGTLAERHWLDIKAEVGTTDSTKKGFAKDLAAFANDGGALLIGVREDKPSQTLTVEPVLLDGLPETVDQIARSRCDPPLYVICHPLVAPAQADGKVRGLLLVEIPPSPSAPHMVDHRYHGRSDTTNHQLTDNDVARLHAVRTARQATAEQIIAAEVARELVQAVPNNVPGMNHASPNWQYLSNYGEPREEGSGFCSYALSGRRFLSDLDGAKEGNLLDVEVQDSGRVTLFCGRASDSASGNQHVVEAGTIDDLLTRSLVTLAGKLGATTGYGGRWLLAVGISDLSGKLSAAAVGFSLGRDYPPFSADAYVQGTEAGTTELLEQPGAVTRRLVNRLLRGLGNHQNYLLGHLLADTAAT